MAKKVILDVDPGIDAAVALAMALFDPRLDVVAVTAVAGTVSAAQATRNVQAIIEQLDPPRWPRIGAAAEPETAPARGGLSALYGVDGLGNMGFQVAELHHQHPAEKVIADELRTAADEITIVSTGPLTNIAQVLRRDVKLSESIVRIVMRAGAVSLPGDVTPAAEFNVYFDPRSARDVFRSRATKTLIPLDVTRQVMLDYAFLEKLPSESTRAGRLLRRILPVAYRANRQEQGLEGIYLNAAVALVAMTDPELFTIQPMAGEVEMSGDLTTGATIFDRRQVPEWRANMDVASEVESPAVADAILRGLELAGSSA